MSSSSLRSGATPFSRMCCSTCGISCCSPAAARPLMSTWYIRTSGCTPADTPSSKMARARQLSPPWACARMALVSTSASGAGPCSRMCRSRRSTPATLPAAPAAAARCAYGRRSPLRSSASSRYRSSASKASSKCPALAATATRICRDSDVSSTPSARICARTASTCSKVSHKAQAVMAALYGLVQPPLPATTPSAVATRAASDASGASSAANARGDTERATATPALASAPPPHASAAALLMACSVASAPKISPARPSAAMTAENVTVVEATPASAALWSSSATRSVSPACPAAVVNVAYVYVSGSGPFSTMESKSAMQPSRSPVMAAMVALQHLRLGVMRSCCMRSSSSKQHSVCPICAAA
mmetsp:Transcript_18482/g.57366  ORF Transcript_18482/g.57366 Transcript_18482/m.57366 type:complete len:362 (-) Transcript_18482:156-1241(-)